jgi:LysR family transcriptional regulator, nod-box dependent transcriptional activator
MGHESNVSACGRMDFKGLDLNLLYVLDALLQEKSVTRTGERIHLSQSATSGALARLREFFDDELLVQIAHKLVLTPLAEELVAPVRDLLMRAEAIAHKIPVFNPAASNRRFRLIMSDYVTSVLMPEVLEMLERSAPGITLELLSNAENAVEVLERGEVDLLIMPKQYLSQYHPSEHLFDDGYVCVVWAHNKSIGDTLSIDQFLSIGHVGVRLGTRQMPVFDEWVFERLGHKRRLEVVTMTFNTVPQLVIGTTRIATIPERLARRYAQHLPLRILPTPMELPRLVEMKQWHQFREADPAVTWFRGLLQRAADLSGHRILRSAQTVSADAQ